MAKFNVNSFMATDPVDAENKSDSTPPAKENLDFDDDTLKGWAKREEDDKAYMLNVEPGVPSKRYLVCQ